MQIQFDPFSFGVAVIAVLVAWRAHFLAKRAPETARRRELRDEIRAQVQVLDDEIVPLATAVQLGKALPKLSEAFSDAGSRLAALAPRVPEHPHVLLVESVAQSLRARWSSAYHDEIQLQASLDAISDWQEKVEESKSINAQSNDFARETLAKYREQVEDGRRSFEANRATLRESLAKWKKTRHDYVAWLDKLDREKGHGASNSLPS